MQVLEGKQFLNKPDGVEDMVLKKWQAPTWRLSCREFRSTKQCSSPKTALGSHHDIQTCDYTGCVVGAINEPGAVKFKLTPQKLFIKKEK